MDILKQHEISIKLFYVVAIVFAPVLLAVLIRTLKFIGEFCQLKVKTFYLFLFFQQFSHQSLLSA
jgi:hypothetical protein